MFLPNRPALPYGYFVTPLLLTNAALFDAVKTQTLKLLLIIIMRNRFVSTEKSLGSVQRVCLCRDVFSVLRWLNDQRDSLESSSRMKAGFSSDEAPLGLCSQVLIGT